MKCSVAPRPNKLPQALSALALIAFGITPALGAPTPAQQNVMDAVEQFIVEQALSLGGEPSVHVATPTRDFAECDSLDVYLPTGRKLASKTTVAVRCLGDSGAPAYVRADVQVEGVYYVPNQTIDANRSISPDLLEPVAGDLLRLPNGTHVDISGLVGRVAKQRLQTGRPIRISATRGADSVLRGQAVRIEARAPGITITNQGEALSSADVGSPVQIKTAQGKTLQAIVKGSGVVTLSR